MTEIEVRSPYEQHPQREAMKGLDLLFAEIGTSVADRSARPERTRQAKARPSVRHH
jgi:hypothetical protein